MYIVVVLECGADERVRARLHMVHDAVLATSRITWSEDVAEILHRIVLRHLRPLLRVLTMLREAQAEVEAQCRADVARLGHRRSFMAVVHPLVYHDACTLYRGLLSSWVLTGDPCGTCEGVSSGTMGLATVSPPAWQACACGERTWGLTCTPPRIRGWRLVRDCQDDLVAFCWRCTARRRCHDVCDSIPP